MILAHGRKVSEGTLGDLRTQAALPLTVHVRAKAGRESMVASAFPEATAAADMLTLTCPQTAKLEMMTRLSGAADAIADFDVVPPGLDDIYAHISRRAA